MKATQERKAIGLLGAAHFFVDFICTALLTAAAAALRGQGVLIAAMALGYNGLAFAFQLPIGALADRLGLTRRLAAVGCALAACGVLVKEAWLLCAVIGIGNACFHVGGGREALARGVDRAAPVGWFVAPGALGIFLGPRLAGCAVFAAAVLAACAAALWRTPFEAPGAPEPLPLSPVRRGAVMGCMFVTVLLRSYMGALLGWPMGRTLWGAAGLTLCIALGKFFGGAWADRWGTFRFCAAAQPLCLVLLLLSLRWQFAAFAALVLLNTTMAVTAHRLYRCAPAHGGALFGLTTLALYLGVVPKLSGWPMVSQTALAVGLLGLLSTAALLTGVRISEVAP